MTPHRIQVGRQYKTSSCLEPLRVLAIVEGWVVLQRGGGWPAVETLDSFAARARLVPKRAKKGVSHAKR